MPEPTDRPTRRQALRAILAVVTPIALGAFLRRGWAQGAPVPEVVKLSEDDPVAKSFHYVHDASRANRRPKMAVPGEQPFCHNCQLLQAGPGEWRPCGVFAGKHVNANGWCSAWLKKRGESKPDSAGRAAGDFIEG